jgi:hypothetical protein
VWASYRNHGVNHEPESHTVSRGLPAAWSAGDEVPIASQDPITKAPDLRFFSERATRFELATPHLGKVSSHDPLTCGFLCFPC